MSVADAIAALHVRTILEPDDDWMFKMSFEDEEMSKNFLGMIKSMGELLKSMRPDMFGNNVDRIVAGFQRDVFDDLVKSKSKS